MACKAIRRRNGLGRTGGDRHVYRREQGLANRGAEAISVGSFDALDEIYAPELAQELKRSIAEIRQAFPDYHGTNEIQIAEGDMVANRFVFHGTHRGEFMGIAPTGREVTARGIAIDRVEGGKIVESWVEVDLEDMVRQIGAVLRAEVPKQSEEASPT